MVTDANNHATTYEIDTSGRVTTVADPLGHSRGQSPHRDAGARGRLRDHPPWVAPLDA